jgi:16S rRNA G1207 methylase RsmC
MVTKVILMKYLQVNKTDKCLDLGCGYGPIGLAVAKSCPQGEVHLVDKDFVAVELSNINAKLNHIDNVKAYKIILNCSLPTLAGTFEII